MRAYSAAYKSTLSSVNAPEAPLILLEISHPDLTVPARVVNDTQDVVCNGVRFIACGFRTTLPDDFENQLPKAKLSVDNVGRELMRWIEESAGGQGSTVRIIQIMRSRPNTIEWEVTLNLYNVEANVMEVTGELGFDNFFTRPSVLMRYDPQTAPGVF